ncbi:hypothetical protein DL98DRAFT_648346 [Cadophora sp. DSE1049]|nr:hypothetical protein DL98DRAFT_648346 [Cadophora sp. DSE1049]
MDCAGSHSQEPKHSGSTFKPSPNSEQKTLLSLPPELLIQISDFLASSSTALFALCNKHLSAILRPQSWISLSLQAQGQVEERMQFLTLLSRDLPPLHACHGCLHLHSSSSIPRPGDPNARHQPTHCIPPSGPSGYSGKGILHISDYVAPYFLRFAHVQLALKRHHHGPEHGISLQDLDYTDLRLVNGNAWFFTVEARIASGELLLRSQEWIVSSQSLREDFDNMRVTHGVCQHLMTYNEEFGLEDTLTGVMRCRIGHISQLKSQPGSGSGSGDDNEECQCMRLQQCLTCPMEFRLDVVDIQHLGYTLCVTKWLNVGSGQTIHDPLWKGHDPLSDEPRPHGLRLGSIRERFESEGMEGVGLGVEGLTEGSKKELMRSLIKKEGRVEMHGGGWGWKEVGGDERRDLLEELGNLSDWRRFAPEDVRGGLLFAVGFSLVVVLIRDVVCWALAHHWW